MTEEIRRVWITKYALTSGVFVTDATYDNERPNMVSYRLPGRYTEYAHGLDFHFDRESAMMRVERMINAKIANLEKQIIKLRSIEIDVPHDLQNEEK